MKNLILIEVLDREVGPYILYLLNNQWIPVSTRGPQVNGKWVTNRKQDTIQLMEDDLGPLNIKEYDNPVKCLMDAAAILHKRGIYDLDMNYFSTVQEVKEDTDEEAIAAVNGLLDFTSTIPFRDTIGKKTSISQDDWLCLMHEHHMDEVTESGMPIWMAEQYGQGALSLHPDNPVNKQS